MPPLTGLNEDHFAPGYPMVYTMGYRMPPFQGSMQRIQTHVAQPADLKTGGPRYPPPTLETRIAPGTRRVILSRGLCGEGSRLAQK